MASEKRRRMQKSVARGIAPRRATALSQPERNGSLTTLSGSSSAVERQLPKLDVTGSIPVSRSIQLTKFQERLDPANRGENRSEQKVHLRRSPHQAICVRLKRGLGGQPGRG